MQWQFFGSEGSYWTNCCKLHCGCERRKIVTVKIFVCWELRKGSVMSCAVRRLTGIVSVNVLMWHQAREIVFGAVSDGATEKNIYFHSLPISDRKYDDLHSLLNNETQPQWHWSFKTDSNLNNNELKSVSLV